jgi:glutathione reductase (NADPH)
MAKNFDVVVIGTGAAATTIAAACRSAGWSVAIVDARPSGGTCALRGCDPKRVLAGAADAMDRVHALQDKGVDGGPAHVVWRDLMRFKRTFTDPVPHQREQGFLASGIVPFPERARFTGARQIAVDGENIEARHFAIATGARPAPLKFQVKSW